jgi:DNA-binding IclR family transcriptional regulator
MEPVRFTRIFEVLELIVERGPQSLSQISNRVKIPTSSTHDLLKAMTLAGMLQVAGKDYELGPTTYRLAFDIQDSFSIINIATPELEKLARQVGFDVYLAVQSGLYVMYAARFRGNEGIKVMIPLGQSLYCHATAAGKTFAAFDPMLQKSILSGPLKKITPKTIIDTKSLEREFNRIKAHKISISNEESFTGIIGISTPITDAAGRIVAATHVSAFKDKLSSARMKELCAELAIATKQIEVLIEAGSSTKRLGKAEETRIRNGYYLTSVKNL